jgi:hypothetical protein
MPPCGLNIPAFSLPNKFVISVAKLSRLTS